MVKQLTTQEYNDLLGEYNIEYCLGGIFGVRSDATIYLVDNEMWFISNEELSAIADMQKRTLAEALRYNAVNIGEQ